MTKAKDAAARVGGLLKKQPVASDPEEPSRKRGEAGSKSGKEAKASDGSDPRDTTERLERILKRFRQEAEDGGEAVDIDAMAAALADLESRMEGMVPLPGEDATDEDHAALLKALGVPDTPDDYDISLSHELFDRDPEIEAKLHAAGFTPKQVQLVYDLAEERMIPLIEDIAGELKADNDIERLVERFGGEEKWGELSRQMLAWGKKHLPEDALKAMTRSYDGVVALYKMMNGARDDSLSLKEGASGDLNEDDLTKMMRDPKYWKEKDPALVKKVTQGFKRLYPGD